VDDCAVTGLCRGIAPRRWSSVGDDLRRGVRPFIILCSSFFNRNSVWKLGAFDIAFGLASGLGIVVWIVSSSSIVALVSFMAADCIAGLSTICKSWKVP